MAPAIDFASWAEADLVLALGDRDFIVRPPSVADSAKLIASAVRAEVNLGLKEGPVPDAVQEILDSIRPDDHPALGDVYQELVEAGASPVTIDRMAYYSVFYWTRGREYADAIAVLLWTPREAEDEADDPAPKG